MQKKNNLTIPNLELLLYIVYNSDSLEYSHLQSNYILFNHNGFFTKQIENKFPAFHKSLHDGMKEYRILMGKPITDSGINFYMFTVISCWENVIAQLYQSLKTINVLLISGHHQKHAQMMKEFILFEFGKQLAINTTNSIYKGSEIADLSDYDLIITSYMDKRLADYRSIYITDIPSPENLDLIQSHIKKILESRLNQ